MLLGRAALAGAEAPTGQKPAAQELHIYCWTEYIPESLMARFTEETGITLYVENYSSNAELMRRRLVGGRHDLVQPSDYAVEAMIKAGVLERLDRGKLPNLRNLDPEFTGLPHDPEGAYSVPWMAGSVGIVVDTLKIKTPVTRVADVFSGAFAGRIVALADPREWTAWVLKSLDLPINELTPTALEAARPVLEAWIPQVVRFDSDRPHAALLEGVADVGVVWSGEAALLLQQDPRFEYILPAEGAHRFVDCLAIPKGARHLDAAHAFIDFILRPEMGALISREYPYTSPNAEARKLLNTNELKNPASYPPAGTRLESMRDVGTAMEAAEKLINDIRWKTKPQ
jgi:spermidine/putrescine transport system substrate-binding protein